MLKLKLQYFSHLMQRVDSLEKTLMLRGIGGRRRRGQQGLRWLDGITDWMDMALSELRKLVMDREAWRAVIQGVAKSRTWLSNWNELNWRNEFNIIGEYQNFLGFPCGSAVKNLPAMQETPEMQVWSLGREDPLKDEMATHSSILAWKIPWTEVYSGL